MRGDASAWRLSWLGGLATGALAMSALCPEGFFAFPESYTLARAACGGEEHCALSAADEPHALRQLVHTCKHFMGTGPNTCRHGMLSKGAPT